MHNNMRNPKKSLQCPNIKYCKSKASSYKIQKIMKYKKVFRLIKFQLLMFLKGNIKTYKA